MNRSPEDWLVQEIATAVLYQFKRLPGASVGPDGQATGPTVRLIAAIAKTLAKKIDRGEIIIRDKSNEALERLRGLAFPNAIRERLRKAGWQGAVRKLSASTPLEGD